MNPQDVPPQGQAPMNNMPPQQGPQQPMGSGNDTTMGIICYIGPLFVIPLIAGKRSPFVTFHVNQGLNLLIASIGAGIIASIFNRFVPIPLNTLVSLASLVLMVMGILNAKNGLMKPLPVIGGLFNLVK